MDLLTLNYGLPSILTILSTWATIKRGHEPLIKLSACWALPVFPVLSYEKSDVSSEKSVKRKISSISRPTGLKQLLLSFFCEKQTMIF